MRLPTNEINGRACVDYDKAVPLLQEAYHGGINFFDSHHNYHGGESEIAIGKALSEFPRESYYIQTKNPHYRPLRGRETLRSRLEKALKKLKTDYIDFYLLHSLQWQQFAGEKRTKQAMKDMLKAKEEGLVRHVGMSTHDTPENVLKLLKTGAFDMMLCQYSLLALDNEPAMRYAKRNGIGVSVMGPVAGGRLAPANNFRKAIPGRKLTAPEAALLYVFANRNVSSAFSGMSTTRQLRENLRTVGELKPLVKEERLLLDEKAKELKAICDLYCTACGYCVPCPHSVAIPEIFGLVNNKRVYGLRKQAHDAYEHYIKQNWSADRCKKCGKCMPKCPQGINIIAQLEEAHRMLSGKSRKK